MYTRVKTLRLMQVVNKLLQVGSEQDAAILCGRLAAMLSTILFTLVRTMLLTPDERTRLNNIVLTTFIKHVSSTLLTLVASCCNNHCSFIKREQVVGTMLLTIVA